MNLYIIGNGFDLHFGLPTKTDDFTKILRNKSSYDGFPVDDLLSAYGVDWHDFEEVLAEFDVDEFALENIIYPNYLSDHETDRDERILNIEYYLDYLDDAIKKSLSEMVENANLFVEELVISRKDLELIEFNSPIINFNYTSTVEKIYGLECFHIHGCLEKDDELILGYKKSLDSKIERELASPEENHDYYIDEQKKRILTFYHKLKKRYKLDELYEYLNSIEAVEEVIVLGHSLGNIDSEYLKMIEVKKCPVRWIIYHHSNDVLCNAQKLDFFNKMKFVKW